MATTEAPSPATALAEAEAGLSVQDHLGQVLGGANIQSWDAFNMRLQDRHGNHLGGLLLVEVTTVNSNGEESVKPIEIDGNRRPLPEHIIDQIGARALEHEKLPTGKAILIRGQALRPAKVRVILNDCRQTGTA